MIGHRVFMRLKEPKQTVSGVLKVKGRGLLSRFENYNGPRTLFLWMLVHTCESLLSYNLRL